MSPRHLVLVGLPGAGKSAVGRLVAGALRAPFVDADAVVSARAGLTVAEIFARLGEAAFRRLEREAVAEALAGPPAVVAPGGGWAAQPGALAEARGRAFTIYLWVAPDTAAERVERDGEAVRPLLAGNPRARLRNLLAAREGFYRQCDALVAAGDRPAEGVAESVLRLARERAGWDGFP